MNGKVAQSKNVKVRGIELGEGNAQICIPLVGKNKSELLIELEAAKGKKPDLVEWRADFFENLDDTVKVVEMLSIIRTHVEDIPILFTIRSIKEGGNPILLTEPAKIKLIEDVCSTKQVDIIDYELVNNKEDIRYLRTISNKHNVKFILSYHNFEYTPESSVLLEKCVAAQTFEADLVKISVMSKKLDDVLLLLQTTQDAQKMVDLPLVTISMGKYGAITRMFGFVFGSTITFGMGQNSSAPGQIPVDELRTVIDIIKKSTK
ncbi:type I 3-dehydroquinate dehydratase [Halalkalibacter alkalisediminis]|uniref:3-dehydroquinate dehydratase n=1 Tax=Halalkalibacter alkalisediminis TaxID=935616 RepID=A0ABV6NDG5_9BACI|nr:type I 3-dehydroquinate dehydratase [Halalkalibacter alkalisediminis]